MEAILEDVMALINDAMGYLRTFIIGATSFFFAKDMVLKMVASDDNQKASYERKAKSTVIAGVLALISSLFISWVLKYFQ